MKRKPSFRRYAICAAAISSSLANAACWTARTAASALSSPSSRSLASFCHQLRSVLWKLSKPNTPFTLFGRPPATRFEIVKPPPLCAER